jgi:hypothetical protein
MEGEPYQDWMNIRMDWKLEPKQSRDVAFEMFLCEAIIAEIMAALTSAIPELIRPAEVAGVEASAVCPKLIGSDGGDQGDKL